MGHTREAPRFDRRRVPPGTAPYLPPETTNRRTGVESSRPPEPGRGTTITLRLEFSVVIFVGGARSTRRTRWKPRYRASGDVRSLATALDGSRPWHRPSSSQLAQVCGPVDSSVTGRYTVRVLIEINCRASGVSRTVRHRSRTASSYTPPHPLCLRATNSSPAAGTAVTTGRRTRRFTDSVDKTDPPIFTGDSRGVTVASTPASGRRVREGFRDGRATSAPP